MRRCSSGTSPTTVYSHGRPIRARRNGSRPPTRWRPSARECSARFSPSRPASPIRGHRRSSASHARRSVPTSRCSAQSCSSMAADTKFTRARTASPGHCRSLCQPTRRTAIGASTGTTASSGSRPATWRPRSHFSSGLFAPYPANPDRSWRPQRRPSWHSTFRPADAERLRRSAERYYRMIFRTDRSMVSAAFGLARLLVAGGDRPGAVEVLDQVPLTSRHYGEAQLTSVLVLLDGRPITEITEADLRDAACRVDALAETEPRALQVRALMLGTALDWFRSGATPAGDPLFGHPFNERGLRAAIEETLRELARHTPRRRHRHTLVDLATQSDPRHGCELIAALHSEGIVRHSSRAARVSGQAPYPEQLSLPEHPRSRLFATSRSATLRERIPAGAGRGLVQHPRARRAQRSGEPATPWEDRVSHDQFLGSVPFRGKAALRLGRCAARCR